jgi:hypothetical protein
MEEVSGISKVDLSYVVSSLRSVMPRPAEGAAGLCIEGSGK